MFTMKICNKCKEKKALKYFYRRKEAKDGRRARCKICEGALAPTMTDCYQCRNFFLKKRRNSKFCGPVCANRYYCHVYNQSVSRMVSTERYRERNRSVLSERTKKWYRKNKEKAIERMRERRRQRKLKILEKLTYPW